MVQLFAKESSIFDAGAAALSDMAEQYGVKELIPRQVAHVWTAKLCRVGRSTSVIRTGFPNPKSAGMIPL